MIETMITSSVLILAICAIRFILRGKINPRVQYALWGIVALRLVMGVFYPITRWLSGFRSRFSVMNAADHFRERVIAGTPVEPLADNLANGHVYIFEEAEHLALRAAGIDWQLWIMVIWGIGFLILAIWMGIVNRKFYKTLQSQRCEYFGTLPAFVTKKVYIVPGLMSPCYFDFLGDEAIYLPSEVADSETILRHSLAHEMGHVIQDDRRWGDLRCSLLCMFWVNPLVWVAAVLSKRDCELSCDEIAVGLLGEEERFSYGRTLVGLISKKSEAQNLFCSATTMAEGRKAMKERIEVLAKNPRRTVPMLLGVGCIVMMLAACTFTSGMGDYDTGRKADDIVSDVVGNQEKEKALEQSADDLVANAGENNQNPANTRLALETIGQWGNYYQIQLSDIDWKENEFELSVTMYEDANGKILLGDGNESPMYTYSESINGIIMLEFWNLANAGSVGIEVTDSSGTVVAEGIYETKNQEVYKTYSVNQELEGSGGTSATLVSIEEYPNALCLTLSGSTEEALREFNTKNTVYLSWNGVNNEFEWSSSAIAPQIGTEKKKIYLFSENSYPMSQIDSVICGTTSGQLEFRINDLEYHRIQEAAIGFIGAYMTGDVETAKQYGDFSEEELSDYIPLTSKEVSVENLAILYEPEQKETYAEVVFRFREKEDSYTYLNLEMKLVLGEWKVTWKGFEK